MEVTRAQLCGWAACLVLWTGCGDNGAGTTHDGGNGEDAQASPEGGTGSPADMLAGSWILQSMTVSGNTLEQGGTPALVGGLSFQKLSESRLRMRVAFGAVDAEGLLTSEVVEDVFEGDVRADGSFLLETSDGVMVLNASSEGDLVTLTRDLDDPDDTDPSEDAPSRTVATRGALVKMELVGDWEMTEFALDGMGRYDAGACVMFDADASGTVEQQLSVRDTGLVTIVTEVGEFASLDCSGQKSGEAMETVGIARSDSGRVHLHTMEERDGTTLASYLTYQVSDDGSVWSRSSPCAPSPGCENEGPDEITYALR